MSSIDRRAFIANSTLLALAAYAGRAGAQDAPRSSFAAGATAERPPGPRPGRMPAPPRSAAL